MPAQAEVSIVSKIGVVANAEVATAAAAATAKDPTLSDDYAERDRLTTERKANAVALSECNQRIAIKEGPELRDARLLADIAALTPEQRQRLARGGH